MAIRQEQSKYQEKQGDGDCTNNVNVAVKTVGSYYVQNTSKDVVKKTEMIVDNSDDQKTKKADRNKFKNVRTSDQKEVKVRKLGLSQSGCQAFTGTRRCSSERPWSRVV